MALTLDDLPAQRADHLSEDRIIEITDRLVETLTARRAPAIGFVNEVKLERDGEVLASRVGLLETWLDAGLELGNHTYSHPDLHTTPLEAFEKDLLLGERVTRPLAEARRKPFRYFRHPFLHTGRTLEIKAALGGILERHGYRVAPVTIDNSEWIFARAYDAALDAGDAPARSRLAAAYVDYMEAMVEFYEGQSRTHLGTEIPQVLLLHANSLNADHLGTLLDRIAARGYRFTGLDDALTDPVFDRPDLYTGPAGISWIERWAIADGADRALFAGEPVTPEWVRELAGIRE